MLVLSRKSNESIRIGDCIVITVVELSRGRVRLGIEAPNEVPVHREEIFRALAADERPRRPTATVCQRGCGDEEEMWG
jgi:carbon storage regulator